MKIDVDFYEFEDGGEPVKDFLDSLEPKMSAKMAWTINLLKMHGPELRLPFSEHIEDGIFELRAKQGSNISRVLYFFFVGQKAILTNGIIKKTQKIPRRAIETAKKYKADYERRYQDGKL